MLKAMMIITMVSGATYEVKLPTMEQCMAQRSPVEGQSDVASGIPRTDVNMPRDYSTNFRCHLTSARTETMDGTL